ncbi:MAG TPA: tetratricopeptide repeat protein [Usitatibacteraceae bacterium]|nr:tetratricopeptide repeat protein [Usitatibacteraceae bacterium]
MLRTISPLLLTACLCAPLAGMAAGSAPRAVDPSTAVSEARPSKSVSDEQFLYQYLISEIAGQRGRPGLAARGLMDLARETRDVRLARRALEVGIQAREGEAALDAVFLWLEIEPDSLMARQALAALAGTQGSLQSAKTSMAMLLAKPERARTVWMQANNLLARHGDKEAVASAIAELAAPHPDSAEAQMAVARAWFNAKNYALAATSIERAEKLRPQWATMAVLKAQILQAKSNDAAAEYLAQYLKRNPRASEARLQYARILFAQNALLSAREQFRLLARQEPENPEHFYAVGLLSQQIEDLADAETQFRQALELKPRDANPIRFSLGQTAEARKDISQALEWYRQVGEGEYYVNAKLKAAGILAKQDGIDAARRYLAEAQTAAKDAADTRIQLILAEAQLLRDAKLGNEALQVLDRAIDINPETADLHYDRAMIAEKLDRLDLMERDLRKVIELRPEHAHAYNALGYMLADRNLRLDEADQLIRKAIALSPGDAFILDSLGWVQFRQGRIDESLATLRDAYAQRRDPEIAAHLGEVLWMRGDRDEALKVWRGALLEHPENAVLNAVMQRLSPR